MTDAFENGAKPMFKDPTEKSFIKFGGLSDNSTQFGIRSGRFSVKGYVRWAGLFFPVDLTSLSSQQRDRKALRACNQCYPRGLASSEGCCRQTSYCGLSASAAD